IARNREIIHVDNDRVKGAVDKAKGSLKEAAGNLTGDAKLQAEGKADKAKGTVQNAVGSAKDALRENSK
ncbi:MAG TPA: CsbD family protein, partial [Candidatus Binataceae bacterium]|nr:CsbD family protein [Candidatus Binataceae bacterium]